MFIIIGLGNPGAKYAGTRHNIGFAVIDYLASEYNIKVSKLKHKALYGEGMIQGHKVVLAKPQTFMNLSGESVFDLCSYYKVPPENLIVIYDDISIPVGTLRIREKGSDGGHNGMKSIIYMLESDGFPRMRIGIGAPPHKDYELADYVLSGFTKEDIAELEKVVKVCPDALCTIMSQGAQMAASKYNGKK